MHEKLDSTKKRIPLQAGTASNRYYVGVTVPFRHCIGRTNATDLLVVAACISSVLMCTRVQNCDYTRCSVTVSFIGVGTRIRTSLDQCGWCM